MNEIATRTGQAGQLAAGQAPLSEAAQLMAIISDAASNPAVDVGKLEALLNIQDRLLDRVAKEAFEAAFTRLVPRLPRIKKHGVIEYPGKDGRPPSRIPFAKWEDIDAAIRPLLLDEGFTLSFTAEAVAGGGTVMTGILSHFKGHSRRASTPVLPLDTGGGKNNLQAAGSTTSYGQRFTTKMLLNLVFEGEDDDGNRGGTRYIDQAQQAELSALIDETHTDANRFCLIFGVQSLAELEAGAFIGARNTLVQKKAAQARKTGGQ